jgi:formate dehydrogenase iron-sulfur subunit
MSLLHDGLPLRHPVCVEACPEQATIFGQRDELLAEAHRRLAAEPGKYVPTVYGEHEVGGTSVLYISDVPLNLLWYHADPGREPLPELTWAAINKVPPVAMGVMALMAGTYWIIERRGKMMGGKRTSQQAGEQVDGSDSQTSGS